MVMSKAEWRRKRRRQKMIKKYVALGFFAAIVILVLILIVKVVTLIFRDSDKGILTKAGNVPVKQSLIAVSDYSRPGLKLDSVEEIVIHSNNTIGKTAQEQRDYYDSLKLKKSDAERQSMHFIVDLDGKIYQCIPTNEIALAGNPFKSIAIEFCITGADGSMSADTYVSLCKLVAALCDKYDLSEKKVVRHYDHNKVSCPRFFVNEDNWNQFKKDIKTVRNKKSISVTDAPIHNVIEPKGEKEEGNDSGTEEP